MKEDTYLMDIFDSIYQSLHCHFCDKILKGATIVGKCTHNFCHVCVNGILKTTKRCPICKNAISRSTTYSNATVENISQQIRELREELGQRGLIPTEYLQVITQKETHTFEISETDDDDDDDDGDGKKINCLPPSQGTCTQMRTTRPLPSHFNNPQSSTTVSSQKRPAASSLKRNSINHHHQTSHNKQVNCDVTLPSSDHTHAHDDVIPTDNDITYVEDRDDDDSDVEDSDDVILLVTSPIRCGNTKTNEEVKEANGVDETIKEEENSAISDNDEETITTKGEKETSAVEHQSPSKVRCPICGGLVNMRKINQHLDLCVSRTEKKESLRKNPAPKRERRPTATDKELYKVLTTSEMRKVVSDCGLNGTGSKSDLIRRHRRYTKRNSLGQEKKEKEEDIVSTRASVSEQNFNKSPTPPLTGDALVDHVFGKKIEYKRKDNAKDGNFLNYGSKRRKTEE